jgi:S-formylglutathione hydrolase FrmB
VLDLPLDAPQAPTPTPAPQLPPPDFHAFNSGISLLGGWFPTTVEIVTIVALVAVVGWRTKRWRLIWVPVSVVVAVLGALGARLYMDTQGLASDPAPLTLWAWVGVFVAAVAIAVLGWRGTGWRRRSLSVLTIPLALVTAFMALNQWVGYYPTVQAAWGGITAGPLPDQVDAGDLPSLRGTQPPNGKLVEVDTPDTASGFKHRSEYVYLPPAWFAGDHPPRLPVVMMIGGEFNTPADWMRSGNIKPIIDGYANGHGGTAPIFVFVDSGGSFNNDTECVNGPRGDAADHLTKDIRPYVVSQFGASQDAANWGVVGWSMGGTCAVDLAVTHPEMFSAFVDIAGDHSPIAGTKQQTIDRLYGGDATQWAAFDPATVMAKHGPYTGVSGWFEDTPKVSDDQMKALAGSGFHPRPQPQNALGFGGHDEWANGAADQVGAAQDLCQAATAVNISCTVHTIATFHTWQFAAYAFSEALPWLATQLHTSPGR